MNLFSERHIAYLYKTLVSFHPSGGELAIIHPRPTVEHFSCLVLVFLGKVRECGEQFGVGREAHALYVYNIKFPIVSWGIQEMTWPWQSWCVFVV
jgi:hypothetical protein